MGRLPPASDAALRERIWQHERERGGFAQLAVILSAITAGGFICQFCKPVHYRVKLARKEVRRGLDPLDALKQCLKSIDVFRRNII
jgi:hypothetical protein